MDAAVNQRIKKLRKALKLNQTEFASRLGITQTSLSQIEKEKHGISLDVFKGLVNNIGISPMWLLNGIGKIVRDDIPEGDKPHLIPHLTPHLIENPSLNPSPDPSLIADDKDLVNTAKYDNLNISDGGDSTDNLHDTTDMKPEDFDRLLRVEDRLRRQLGIQEDLISVMREEIHELRQIIEDHANSEKQGEVRRFKKTS